MSWQQANFDLSAFAGIPIKIEVRYASDATGLGPQGFWFDHVVVANPQSCDLQTNSCSPLPAEVSPDAAAVQFTMAKAGSNYDLRFSEISGATSYNLYGGTIDALRAHTYDHAAAGGVCSLTDGTPGDGQVLASVPAATLGANTYYLVAAKNGQGESIYGKTSTGATIPLALSACP
jgi:hypothetical protein